MIGVFWSGVLWGAGAAAGVLAAYLALVGFFKAKDWLESWWPK